MTTFEDGQSFVSATLQKRRRSVLVAACLITCSLILIAILSLGTGALPIPAGDVVRILAGLTGLSDVVADTTSTVVVLNVRLPRLVMGVFIGAGLAVSGALMQGLFRNPLADPGLVGVSAGAALAAGITIVLGTRIFGAASNMVPFILLPIGAFVGGLLSTLLLYTIATRRGRTSISTMLLAGVAIGALSGACSGFLAYLSDEQQLRDLTFWSLGSLAGATWSKVAIVVPVITGVLLAMPFLARGLNALVLGEAEAFDLGVRVQTIKGVSIFLTAVTVAVAVAASGIIGFVGLVIPHVLRLLVGPDHRSLLPLCAISGAVLLTGADVIARTVVSPAELPIGILTAALGAPFFLWLLLSRDRGFEQ